MDKDIISSWRDAGFEYPEDCLLGTSTTIRIEISSGRTLNLLKDDLTTQDMRKMSGVEVRMIRKLQEEIAIAKGCERAEKIYKETGLLVAFN